MLERRGSIQADAHKPEVLEAAAHWLHGFTAQRPSAQNQNKYLNPDFWDNNSGLMLKKQYF